MTEIRSHGKKRDMKGLILCQFVQFNAYPMNPQRVVGVQKFLNS